MTTKTKPSLKVVPPKNEEPKQPHIFDPEFRWTRGADVQKTWRKYGWVPPTETKFKHIYDDALPNGNT